MDLSYVFVDFCKQFIVSNFYGVSVRNRRNKRNFVIYVDFGIVFIVKPLLICFIVCGIRVLLAM